MTTDYPRAPIATMLNTTNNFADTTDYGSQSGVIDDVLQAMRISGSLLLNESYSPPWSIAIPNAEKLAEILDIPSGARVVAFHLVEFGHCLIKQQNGEEMLLTAGEMAICFGGTAHCLSQGTTVTPQPVENLLRGDRSLPRSDNVARTVGTSLLCGVFLLHHTGFNPLFSALPPVMRATLSRAGELHNLSGVARLMAEEINRRSLCSGYVVERLLEVLCAEALRSYIETVPGHEKNWFVGIKDSVVCRSIAAIHAKPGENWSVAQLASTVSMSASRFAARFSASTGDSPMAYLAKWRMNLACRKLTATRQSIDQIAAELGYESSAAFSRAFKKLVGCSPAVWRAQKYPSQDVSHE